MPSIPWYGIMKVGTGIVIIPLSIISIKLWPWWEEASMPAKILTGWFILPYTGIVALLTFWWADL